MLYGRTLGTANSRKLLTIGRGYALGYLSVTADKKINRHFGNYRGAMD